MFGVFTGNTVVVAVLAHEKKLFVFIYIYKTFAKAQ